MHSAGWMIAVSYLEWIRWVATSRLRSANRVTWVQGVDDQAGFDALMDRAPDLNVEDDHSYVLAVFSEGAPQRFEPAQAGAGLGAVWMPIDVVASFHPLSERGQRLLEADALRASVRLGEPRFEARWTYWQGRRRRELALHRAQMLCKALNLPQATSGGPVSEAVLGILSGEVPPPNADKAERLRGSMAYAWALGFGVFSQLAGEAAKKEFSARFKLPTLLLSMERDYAPGKPVMQSPAIPASQEMTRHLREACQVEAPVSLIAVVLHYSHLFLTSRHVSLESLLEDLTTLGVESGLGIAALAVESVAMAMDDTAATTLMYQATPESFPALSHARQSYSLDIGARVAAHMPQETANPKRVAESPATSTSGSTGETVKPEETDSGQRTTVSAVSTSPTEEAIGSAGLAIIQNAAALDEPREPTDEIGDTKASDPVDESNTEETTQSAGAAASGATLEEEVHPPVSAHTTDRVEPAAAVRPNENLHNETLTGKKKNPGAEVQAELDIGGGGN
jgi:hypothetical protein